MHAFLFQAQGVKKNFIPYMVPVELTYIHIKNGVVNANVDGFFNCSGSAMVLPPYYLEVVLCGGVASSASVVMYRGGFL